MTHDPKVPPRYPFGTVRALLQSEHVSVPTRTALQARLEPYRAPPPVFLSAEAVAILRAATRRLLALDEPARLDMIVCTLHSQIASGIGDGWRYAAMPPDGDATRLGLAGIEETARIRFAQSFIELSAERQDDVLTSIQTGAAEGDTWQRLPASRFFEELLATLSAIYYSDPIALEEIGYVGMADRPGWHAVGLNELTPREPRPLPPSHG